MSQWLPLSSQTAFVRHSNLSIALNNALISAQDFIQNVRTGTMVDLDCGESSFSGFILPTADSAAPRAQALQRMVGIICSNNATEVDEMIPSPIPHRHQGPRLV